MTGHPPQVGAPDPGLKTSPILDNQEKGFPPDAELESGVCCFNGVACPIGAYVPSGSELLHCERRGVWMVSGDMRSDQG